MRHPTNPTDFLLHLEDTLAAIGDEAIPIVLGEFERLKALLLARWLKPSKQPEGEPSHGQPLVDVPQAARALGISRTALRRLELGGELPSVRIGRRVLFRSEVLARFMEDHERQRPSAG